MSGKVLLRVSRRRHRCNPPGLRERHRLDLDFGSVWECDCGERWEWACNWAESGWSAIGRTTPEPTERCPDCQARLPHHHLGCCEPLGSAIPEQEARK